MINKKQQQQRIKKSQIVSKTKYKVKTVYAVDVHQIVE